MLIALRLSASKKLMSCDVCRTMCCCYSCFRPQSHQKIYKANYQEMIYNQDIIETYRKTVKVLQL
jgi:hypothetical protein